MWGEKRVYSEAWAKANVIAEGAVSDVRGSTLLM